MYVGKCLADERQIRCKGALAIRRIFSIVDMITKPKFSNCPNVFAVALPTLYYHIEPKFYVNFRQSEVFLNCNIHHTS